MKKKVILPPARAPMSLDECAESFEKTARLLKQMKEKGINSEDRTKTAIAELTGERGHPPPKPLQASPSTTPAALMRPSWR